MTAPISKAQERVIKAAVAWFCDTYGVRPEDSELIASWAKSDDLEGLSYTLARAVASLLAEREKGEKDDKMYAAKCACGHERGWHREGAPRKCAQCLCKRFAAKPKKGGRS